MKFAVLFTELPHGSYLARVPDIPNLEAGGRTLDHARASLLEAVGYMFHAGVPQEMPAPVTYCEMIELDCKQQ